MEPEKAPCCLCWGACFDLIPVKYISVESHLKSRTSWHITGVLPWCSRNLCSCTSLFLIMLLPDSSFEVYPASRLSRPRRCGLIGLGSAIFAAVLHIAYRGERRSVPA